MSPSRVSDVDGEIWDTHHHIFDSEQFPYSPTRHITPPKASVAHYQKWKQGHDISRSVLVHGLSYGHDCSSLKSFIKALDPSVARGVAVISKETTDSEMNELHQAGVRGIRLDLYSEGAMRDLEKQKSMLQFYAQRIKPWGWSMAFLQLEPTNWEPLSHIIPSLGVNVIVDHHALMRAKSMLHDDTPVLEQAGFSAIVKLLKSENFWIKLSAPYRCSEQSPDYEDMREIVTAFVDTNPKRLVWGSDWPHTPRMKVRAPEEALKETPFLEVDDAAWLKSLRNWLTDGEWRLIMIENPSKLYGW